MLLQFVLLLFFFHPTSKNQLQVLSLISRNLSTHELKSSNYDRGFCAVRSSLTISVFLFIGSKVSLTLFTHHKPVLFLFSRKGNSPHYFKLQLLLTKFFALQLTHTASTNFTVTDLLSTDSSKNSATTCQTKHKTLPPHIELLHFQTDSSSKKWHHFVELEKLLPTKCLVLIPNFKTNLLFNSFSQKMLVAMMSLTQLSLQYQLKMSLKTKMILKNL